MRDVHEKELCVRVCVRVYARACMLPVRGSPWARGDACLGGTRVWKWAPRTQAQVRLRLRLSGPLSLSRVCKVQRGPLAQR